MSSSKDALPSRSAASTCEKITFLSSRSKADSSILPSCVQIFSRKFCGMYLTSSGCFSSIFSSSPLVILDPDSHVNVAVKYFALSALIWRKFSFDKNVKSPCCLVLHNSPIVSVKALFPLPLLPMIATRPQLSGIVLLNQISGSVALGFLWIVIELMNFVLLSRTYTSFCGSSPTNTRSSGSFRTCNNPRNVGSALILVQHLPSLSLCAASLNACASLQSNNRLFTFAWVSESLAFRHFSIVSAEIKTKSAPLIMFFFSAIDWSVHLISAHSVFPTAVANFPSK